MAYLTREDGEHFVVPSYRDVLTTVQLREQILSLSQNYGSYITLHRKNSTQYEVAFSSDIGYLLGESVWSHFKRPNDLVYCEAIPNTTEAILVVVQGGSVYLDGSFSIDSIQDELVVFLTQKNNFDIYIYGDVPISQKPEEGKFAFEASSVKSFTVLQNPIFPTLALIKSFKLEPVEAALRANQISKFPIKSILILLIISGLGWVMWSFIFGNSQQEASVSVDSTTPTEDPYKDYRTALASPIPEEEVDQFFLQAKRLLSMPGWSAGDITYSKGTLTTTATSMGSRIQTLLDWAKNNQINATLNQNNITISIPVPLPPARKRPQSIYPLQSTIATLTDRLEGVYPGNHLQLGTSTDKKVFKSIDITINFSDISPDLFRLIAMQCKDLPIVLQSISFKISNSVSGSIVIQALGS